MIGFLKKTAPLLLISLVIAGGVELFYTALFPRLLFIPAMPADKAGQVPKIAAAPSAPAAGARPTAQAQGRNEAQIIVERKLFGQAPKKEEGGSKANVAPQLTVTALEVSLVGTIDGAPKARRAILLDKKKKTQDIYYQGDEVQGALIKEIQRGKVVLTLNGKDEILVPEVPKKNAATGAPSAPSMDMPVAQPVAEAPVEPPSDTVVEPEPIEPTPPPVPESSEPAPAPPEPPSSPPRHPLPSVGNTPQE
jgi:general secretion pathway protein C